MKSITNAGIFISCVYLLVKDKKKKKKENKEKNNKDEKNIIKLLEIYKINTFYQYFSLMLRGYKQYTYIKLYKNNRYLQYLLEYVPHSSGYNN